ncbi:MAG: hypothetical protein KKE20_05495 [Nanoarchaeota archaeon]|nr:hypothetical protein [Nanoarchaeota archaeon]
MSLRPKLVIAGLGDIGKEFLRLALKDMSLSVVGAVDNGLRYKDIVTSRIPLGEFVGAREYGPVITDDLEKTLDETDPNILVLTTSSELPDIIDSVNSAVQMGIHIISPAEQLFFPEYVDTDLAHTIDEYAKEKKVCVVGRGVNPGLLMDLYPAHAASQFSPEDISLVDVYRWDNTLNRRLALLKKTGCWLTEDEFIEKNSSGEKGFGHVGAEMSAAYIAHKLGIKDYSLRFERTPVMATSDIKPDNGDLIRKGQACGLQEMCRVYQDGSDQPIIRLNLRMNAEQVNRNCTIIHLKDGTQSNHDYSNIVNGDQATVRILHDLVFQTMYSKPGLNRMDYVPDPAQLLKKG